ncbi:hypothetical protein [Solidesulfovibrio sp.]|uniref:hypothetical protein n=1 Tax=Solidesulfovibrio sp. TaxID=2910990 RepID=UPI002B20804B|nr:hypothetical protein [Solidesulfovibrio sp.]MEA5088423.1 hypothetical protein [Solidesulfovibrio sp.]
MKRLYLALYSTVYTLSYGLILLNSGIYSDDHCYAWHSPKTVEAIVGSLNIFPPVLPRFFSFFFELSHYVLIQRVIVFLCFYLSGILVYKLANKILGETPSIIASLFFSIYPGFFLRLEISTVHYTICYFLFYSASLLYAHALGKKRVFSSVLATIFLFTSYTTHSLIFFSPVLVAYLWLLNRQAAFKPRELGVPIGLISIATILYILVQTIYFPQTNYHKIRFDIVNLLILHAVSYYRSLFLTINESIHLLFNYTVTMLLLSTAIYFCLKKLYTPFKLYSNALFLFGLLALSCGMVAYNLLGYPIGDMDLYSRHQLLVPLGAALILLAIIDLVARQFKSTSIFLFAAALIVACFISYNINKFVEYQVDWYKQRSLILNFRNSELVRNNTTFVVQDCEPELNASGRMYRIYEYTGLMKAAFGTETRYVTDYDPDPKVIMLNKTYTPNGLRFSLYYNIDDYVESKFQALLLITKGKTFTNTLYPLIVIIYQEFFNKQKFEKTIDEFMSVTAFPFQNGDLPFVLCGERPSRYWQLRTW